MSENTANTSPATDAPAFTPAGWTSVEQPAARQATVQLNVTVEVTALESALPSREAISAALARVAGTAGPVYVTGDGGRYTTLRIVTVE